MERIKVPGIAYKEPFERHIAESKWQFCNCQTCQETRDRLDKAPGTKINYETYRRKDERY